MSLARQLWTTIVGPMLSGPTASGRAPPRQTGHKWGAGRTIEETFNHSMLQSKSLLKHWPLPETPQQSDYHSRFRCDWLHVQRWETKLDLMLSAVTFCAHKWVQQLWSQSQQAFVHRHWLLPFVTDVTFAYRCGRTTLPTNWFISGIPFIYLY